MALVFLLRFENSGTTITDEVPGNTWTASGGATQSTTSPITGLSSLDLSSAEGGVSSTTAAVVNNLAGTRDWRMDVRIKGTTTPPWFFTSLIGSNVWNLNLRDSNELDFEGANSGNQGGFASDGSPHLLTASYVNSTQRVYLFIDGTLVANVAYGASFSVPSVVWVGKSTGSSTGWRGKLDEARYLINESVTASFTDDGLPFPGPAGGDVTVALTGVEGPGSVGDAADSLAVGLTGAAGTGSPGTVVQSRTKALTNNVGTGSVGSATPASAADLGGNEASATAGDVTVAGTPDVTVELTGVEGAGSPGDVQGAAEIDLSGASATTAVGTVAISAAYALSGVAGSSEPGSVDSAASAGLSGTQGDSDVGDVVALSGANAELTGAQSDSDVGDVGASVTIAISGVEGVGMAGDASLPGSGGGGGYDDRKKQKRLIDKAVKAANEAIAAEQAVAVQVAQIAAQAEYDDDEEVLMLLL